MLSPKNTVSFRFMDKMHIVQPCFRLVHEIEQELGGIAELQERFLQKRWKISELVSLVHMMLQNSGETIDYVFLGNQMLKEGLGRYLLSVQALLQIILYVE